ncbi:thiamine pyrophosphate-binding protein [Persicimonas caeni]|uniref:Thiamine pyrophosphate-binding protein n=1 Tax=Persicimonas caeni TaxID=2292766 RepID=A0A4Y6PZX7_PERCE|nr:thiamine pyrophosphate-binding protein [Persicimonas caeni]QDG53557.1 thiamine pyrophosphate-binding protein [Persicimonas caeni]QED34778.1 thiamine pyrophosphate-binding protein [Persicimonas caeni]
MADRDGGYIIAEQLRERGVEYLFTLCGGHISPILVGSKNLGIDVVDVRDEASAVFAADAVARMTGNVGVAAVTAGPGVTNTVTAVKNAQMAQSPVLVLGGATATILRGRGSLQDIDQMSLMKPIVKWCTRVTTVKALGPTIKKALDVATSGVPGPVFVEVPIDLLYPEEIVRGWYLEEAGLDDPKTLLAKGAQLGMKAYLARQFHQPHISVDLSPPSVDLPFGKSLDAKLDKAADALARAEKPVLVVGNQTLVNMNQRQAREVAEAIEMLGIPVWLGGMARGLLGRDSDIQFFHKRTASLKKCDYAIVAGFPFDFRLGYGRKISSKATLVSANLSEEDLTKNRKPDIPLQMHPGEFLIRLAERMGGGKRSWDLWFGEIREREEKRNADIDARATEGEELVHPIYFFKRLEELMGDNAVIAVDGGDFVATGAYVLRPRQPLNWLDPGVFGTLGVGGGFALGGALCRPDSEIWLIWGDGSSAYSLAEFDTYIRHGLAPIAVVGTDASWAQIARDQTVILEDDVGTCLRHTEYHKVAEGYGGKGILVTDEAEVDDAIKEAQKLASEGVPVLINLHLAPSDFRKGSISV